MLGRWAPGIAGMSGWRRQEVLRMRVQIALQVVAASLMAGACFAAAPAAAAGVALAPHRAVYDLKLLKSHGKRSVEAGRGRILYDFSRSPPESYALQVPQVSEIHSREGEIALSD